MNEARHRCVKCGEEKLFSAFRPRRDRPIGRSSQCIECLKSYGRTIEEQRAYRLANLEASRAKDRAYRERHLEEERRKDREYKAETRRKDPIPSRIAAAKWQKLNPAKVCAIQNKRRAKKLGATPSWANPRVIGEAYSLARMHTLTCGFSWHVDHIVPLQSELVCGLHVEHNLRVIPAAINFNKGNRRWPDMSE